MENQDNAEGAIPTNLRLLLVIEEIAKAGVPVTPTEMNRVLNLPKPTIHRLFATLEAEGFIQREIDGREYSPGLRLRTLSADILSSLRIRTARMAILTRLSEQIGETCNIALPERDGMIAVGVPILGPNGRLISTLSFHAPLQRLTLQEALSHLDILRDSAKGLSALVVD